MTTATNNSQQTSDLAARARACQICKDLPLGPKPLFQLSPSARLLIAGQAPGSKTHEKGIPFDDPSGNRLRDWLGIDRDTFYDADKIAIIPMGFCFPGTGKSGDLPPRAECAPAWRDAMLNSLERLDLTLVIGRYARDWHLPDRTGESLTQTIADWQALAPSILPLPHPSPRNNRWLKQNPWFESEVLPMLKTRVSALIAS